MVASVKRTGFVECLAAFSILSCAGAFFTNTPADTLVILGDSTQLNCSYTTDSAFAVWYKGEGENKTAITVGREPHNGNLKYEIVGDADRIEYNLRIWNTTNLEEDIYECSDMISPGYVAPAYVYGIVNKTVCALNETNTTVITGDDVTFICTMEIDDEAPGDLVWYRDGSEVSRVSGTENVLTTTLYDGDNGATFYCRLEHFTLPVEKWTELTCEDTITMNVEFEPSLIISNVTGTAGIEGDYFAALCEITQIGNPPDIDEVYWINPENDTIFYGSPLLEIETLDRAYAGQYQCVMSNTLHDGTPGIGKASFILDVQYPYVVNITNTTGTVAMEGDFYAARCDIDEIGNPVDGTGLYWFDPSGSPFNYDEHTLQMNGISRSDGGQYVCVLSNTFYNGEQGISQASTYVDVQYSPYVTIMDISDARVIENDRYEANCTVDAHPTATTAWEYTADNVTVVDVYLTIESAQRHHAGVYTCESNNTLYTGDTGYGVDTIDLDVQYRPVVNDGHAYCIGGDNVDLVCVVDEGNPYPNSFTWTKDGNYVSSGQTYNIPSCDLSHAGIYTCTAANVFHDGTEGRDEGMTELVVHLRPTILTDDIQTLEVEAGDNVTLVCRADAYPVATISWRDNKDQPITGDEPNREIITPEPEGTISTSTLHIRDIQDSDFGEYNCTATNEIGKDSHTGEILRKELSESLVWWLLLAIIVIVVILLIVCVATLYLFIRNRKKSSKESAEVTDSKPIADETKGVTSYENVALYPLSTRTPYPKQEKFSAYYAAQRSQDSQDEEKETKNEDADIPENKNMYDLYDELINTERQSAKSRSDDTNLDFPERKSGQKAIVINEIPEEYELSSDDSASREGN